MGTQISFQTFLNSGLHNSKQRVVDVYSLLIYQKQDDTVRVGEFKNEFYIRHSEENAIAKLRKMLDKNDLPSQTITWFINFSPCHQCSDKIISFIKEARLQGVIIRIDMRFPFLYRVKRPSCTMKSCPHQQQVSECDHGKNLHGLRELEKNGVSLHTFELEEWELLAEYTDYRDLQYMGSSRQKEDELMKKDFQRLMRPTFYLDDLFSSLTLGRRAM